MPKCNKCGTIYGPDQRKKLIEIKNYWCVLCSSHYKIFNPFPAQYFRPELTVEEVIKEQIRMWECGTRDGYFRNKMQSAS